MATSNNVEDLGDSKIIHLDNSKTTKSTSLNHVVHKRRPLSFPKTKNDIYVTHKQSFKAQLNRCEKCFTSGESEIIIHGLGAAVTRACNLALQLKNNHKGILDFEINTSTVELTDDIEPLDDDYDDQSISKRNKSAIHIKVFKIVDIGSLKYA